MSHEDSSPERQKRIDKRDVGCDGDETEIGVPDSDEVQLSLTRLGRRPDTTQEGENAHQYILLAIGTATHAVVGLW